MVLSIVSCYEAYVDPGDAWIDTVSHYKTPSSPPKSSRIKILLPGQPALDTGGVWCQLHSLVFHAFAENAHLHLFDGPQNHLQPLAVILAVILALQLFFFISLELWNMLQFITGCQVPKRTSIKVNFIEDLYGAIVVHTCCNTGSLVVSNF